MKVQANGQLPHLPLPKGVYLNDPDVVSPYEFWEPYDHWNPTSMTVGPGQSGVLRGWVAVENKTPYALQMSTKLVEVKPGFRKTLLEIKGEGPEGSFILQKHIRVTFYSCYNPNLSIRLQTTEKGTEAILEAHELHTNSQGHWWEIVVLKEALLKPITPIKTKTSFRKLNQIAQRA